MSILLYAACLQDADHHTYGFNVLVPRHIMIVCVIKDTVHQGELLSIDH